MSPTRWSAKASTRSPRASTTRSPRWRRRPASSSNAQADRDLTIRPEAAADHDAIADVVMRAFGSPTEARLVADIRASVRYVPAWALVAVSEGRVTGHVMVSYATLRGDHERHIAMLSPLAVDPAVQRSGIGSALVRSVCAAVDAAREPLIVLEGSPAYYSRFGFEYSVPLGITLPLPGWAPPEAGQVLRLQHYDAALRGNVVYPPAFDHVD